MQARPGEVPSVKIGGKGKADMRQLKFAALSYELHSKDPKNIWRRRF